MYKHAPHLTSNLLLTGKLIIINNKTRKAYVLKDLEILLWYLLKECMPLNKLVLLAGHSKEDIMNCISTLKEFGLIIENIA